MRVSFGEHVLDTESRHLERGADIVHMSPKALSMLQVLLEERPRSVSKRVLLDRVWPDAIVEEQNVKNTIVEIRRALGKDAAQIRTVQRFGYAFSGVAREAEAPRYWLYCESRRIPIAVKEMSLGRDPACTLCLDHAGVSRRHALIRLSGEIVTIEDLGSKNGTWVGELRIEEPTQLREADRIRIGTAILTLRATPASGSTLTTD